jgi:hypothetical protein
LSNYGRTLAGMCRFCASFGTLRIGECAVCGQSVCDKCGDVHHVRGEKRVIHHDCLAHEDSPFKMIKFVK